MILKHMAHPMKLRQIAAQLFRHAFIKNCALPDEERKFIRAPASAAHIKAAYVRPCCIRLYCKPYCIRHP